MVMIGDLGEIRKVIVDIPGLAVDAAADETSRQHLAHRPGARASPAARISAHIVSSSFLHHRAGTGGPLRRMTPSAPAAGWTTRLHPDALPERARGIMAASQVSPARRTT